MRNSIKQKNLRNIFYDFALAFYLCVCFAHQLENTTERVLRYASLALLLAACVIHHGRSFLRLRSNRKTLHYVLWLLGFMAYGSISCLWARSASNVLSVLFNVLKVALACFFLLPDMNSKQRVHRVLKIVLLSLCYMLVILLIKTPFSAWGSERVGAAIYRHSNSVGRYCALGLLLCAYFSTQERKEKYIYYVLMAAFGAVGFLTGSKGFVFSMLFQIGLFFLLLAKRRRRLLAVFSAVIAVFFMYWLIMNNEVLFNMIGIRIKSMMETLTGMGKGDGSTRERLFFMQTAWEVFKSRPIFGIGMNNFSAYLGSIAYSNAKYSHSGYLEILSTLGIVGFLIYYSLFFRTASKLLKPVRKRNRLAIVLFVYVANALLFDISTISAYDYPGYLFLMLAFCAGEFLEKKKTPQNLFMSSLGKDKTDGRFRYLKNSNN